MADIAVFLKFAVTSAAIAVLVCRLDKMDRHTLPAVRHQHAWLCASLLYSLVVPAVWAETVIAFGVLVYFLFSTHRWRNGAPEATTSPMPLDAWPRTSGGSDASR
jgi:hypothetical protein